MVDVDKRVTAETMDHDLRTAMGMVTNAVSIGESGRKRGLLFQRIRESEVVLERGITYLDKVEGRGIDQSFIPDPNFQRWHSLLKTYESACKLAGSPE